MKKARKDGKKVKLVLDTLFIDCEVYTNTLLDPRVDSQMNSHVNLGDRLPKKARARHLLQTVMDRDTKESS